ncbi:hypothetical protein ACIBQ1_38445 [Nonomuraea sp. NPDC050153]|uniref:hypothetical protein n=1 Tax=Nonomuraea sp. NPDC050153 TaxID=3364359 RepID=UPI0037B44624
MAGQRVRLTATARIGSTRMSVSSTRARSAAWIAYVVGGVVGGWVGDAAIWGYDKARKPVINAAKSIGSGIKKGWNKLFG